MSGDHEIRWERRLDNLVKAVSALTRDCRQDDYSELERAGLIKEFEICFELSLKVLKDLLLYEGYDTESPREVIRRSFESGKIDENDCEVFLEILKSRDPSAHVYEKEFSLKAEGLIKNRYHPIFLRLCELLEKERGIQTDGLKDEHRDAIVAVLSANKRIERAVLFGSRATRTYKATSDVDLALFGDQLTLTDLAKLADAIDELPMAQRVDLLLRNTISNKALLEQIERHGVEWYRRRKNHARNKERDQELTEP